ncbi:hypothetical protein H3S93_05880 [Bifidobacterium sp. W8109]|uniref:hypothetical protein n=1 Tax=Bifidobacterium TaxID=1678 RepID=UPI0018DD4736|nr:MULTISPECIES: hypothetical protein [Bifidobacterium]MBH9971839.1 hypothetical protein [Bifidobacterium asteroides]MBI0072992.1 hypothetical protein [Bifidobacterium sp. W8110]
MSIHQGGQIDERCKADSGPFSPQKINHWVDHHRCRSRRRWQIIRPQVGGQGLEAGSVDQEDHAGR